MRRCGGLAMGMVLCWAAPAGAAERTDAIPVLVATQFGQDGKELPAPPLATRLVGTLAAEAGLRLTVRTYPWKRAQWLAGRGAGLLYGASPTPERTARFLFSSPLYQVSQWLVVPAGRAFPFDGLDDLRGKVISLPNGAHYLGRFEAMRGKLFTVSDSTETPAGRLRMLALGRVDAVLFDNYRSAPQFERRLNCQYGAIGSWAVLPRPAGAEPVLLAAAKGSSYARLMPALDAAIWRLARSGAFDRILEQQGAKPDC